MSKEIPWQRYLALGLSLRTRVFLTALLPVLVIAIYFSHVVHSQGRLAQTTRDILNNRTVMMHSAEHVKQSLVAYDDALFRYLSIQDPNQLTSGLEFKKEVQEDIQQLKLHTGSSILEDRLDALDAETVRYFSDAERLLAFSRESGVSSSAINKSSAGWSREGGQKHLELAFLSEEGKSRLVRVFSLCDEIITVNRISLEQAQKEMEALFAEDRKTGLVAGGISVATLGILAGGFVLSLLWPLGELLKAIRQIEQGNLEVEVPISTNDEVGEVARAFNRATSMIHRQKQQLLHESVTDELTGAYNQRHFRKILKQEIERASRSGQPLSLMMVDLDHFKECNDTFGHEYGNTILREVSGIIRENIREVDILVRYGGDEFAVILPQSGDQASHDVAQRILDSIRAYSSRLSGKNEATSKLGVSIGGASFPQDASSIEVLVHKADEALYSAKEAGRNCIRWAGSEIIRSVES